MKDAQKNWVEYTSDLNAEELLQPYSRTVRTKLNKMMATTQFLLQKAQNMELLKREIVLETLNKNQSVGLHFILEELDFSAETQNEKPANPQASNFSDIKVSLAKKMILQMGGSVWMEKKTSSHRLFHFLIPLK